MADKPTHYPNTLNSGIFDAGAFRFDSVNSDNGGKMHLIKSFPDGARVVAKCGTFGNAGADTNRGIHWASGYGAEDYYCPTCLAA